MPHTFHQLYYHFVWTTRSGEPLVSREWRPRLLDVINEETKNRGGWPIRHNAMPDHVHLLVRLPPIGMSPIQVKVPRGSDRVAHLR